jgi:signal peptide peptidase SppA
MNDYRRVLSYFYGQPWALERSKFDEIEAILLARAAGERLSDEEIRARIGQGQRPPLALWDIEAEAFLAADGQGVTERRQVVSVIGVYGVITHRASMFTQTSGLASAEGIQSRVRAAASDPGVTSIVLDVDSPGGSVFGIQELAAEIRAARAQKPVKGIANAMAGSAGYWILAQADESFVTPSGQVGSVGIFVEHEDRSEANAKAGIKITTITYGKNKMLGSPNEPLSDEARAELEKRVSDYGQAFEEDVAKGRTSAARRMTAAKVRSEFGQGLMFGAAEAVERGMVDRIGMMDEVLRRAGGRTKAPAVVAAEAPKLEPAADAERLAAVARIRGL